jgi:hypothetical protein
VSDAAGQPLAAIKRVVQTAGLERPAQTLLSAASVLRMRLTSTLGPERYLGTRAIYEPVRQRRGRRVEARWRARGCPAPPPAAVKWEIIADHMSRHGLHVLVETGTYLGGTVDAFLYRAAEIHSIELEPRLAARAQRRYRSFPHVHPAAGDSGVELPRILQTLGEPALFWLDGHASGGITAAGPNPVRAELRAVLDGAPAGSVVLIDDARLFVGDDYPSVDEIADLVRPRFAVAVSDDVIRLEPVPA